MGRVLLTLGAGAAAAPLRARAGMTEAAKVAALRAHDVAIDRAPS